VTSWIEISHLRLAANFATLQHAAGHATEVLAVVKANAYGHGAEPCAITLAQAGAKWLGVATAAEGAHIRRALDRSGLTAQILVMCGFVSEDAPLFAEHNLTPVLWTPQQVQTLAGTDIPVHIEINTGMNRQGVPPGHELEALLDALVQSNLKLYGVMTHFAAAESCDPTLTLTQQHCFEQALKQIRARSLTPQWIHAGSSSTLDNPTQPGGPIWLPDLAASFNAQAMVRCGIALYGYTLPLSPAISAPRIRPHLRPVLTWKTRILEIHDLAPGESIGYNATYTATSPTRVALLPIGYSDGLRRELSSTTNTPGGWTILHTPDGTHHRAPILGRISMNLTTIDITHIPGIAPGHEVTLLGDHITADDHARLAHTIPYEILCALKHH
jgi:alanine racemase